MGAAGPPDSRPYDDLIIGGGAYCGNNQFPGPLQPGLRHDPGPGVEGARARVLERLARPCTPQQRQELEAMALCLAALGPPGATVR